MKFILFLAILCISHAYVATRWSRAGARKGLRFATLKANKLDGITIEGNLQPVSNNLLIKVKEALSETKGGLFIPDNAKERPTEGEVIAHGPGRVHPETAVQLDIAVKSGVNVMYGKYDGSELKYNGFEHQLIKDDDVLLTYPKGQEATVANVTPVKDQVLIKLPPKIEANQSGIIIATPTEGEQKKRADYGTVVKTGPGRQAGNGKYMEPQVKSGDNVRFRDFAGNEIKLDGGDYLVIRAYDVLAKW
jgi:chaperonin GroES